MLEVIEALESNVRGYVRMFPTVFDTALGSELWDVNGRRYIDFFCGAGTLNYGHNNPVANEALIRYIQRHGIQHGLDTGTRAKVEFLEAFRRTILGPRGMNYRIQFTGPTGTNAVEAAIKLSRKQKQRSHIVAFTHGYHGHTLGSLTLTANRYYHDESYGSRANVTHFPFDGYLDGIDTADLLDRMLSDPSSGLPIPAAVILETVQGEGGVNVASASWLRKVEALCRRNDILLIVDDIQVGNGRTGNFFSYEESGIAPDIICLSKAIAGGLPMSLVLIRPEVDAWKPGQHTGTFRGHNLAFVTAKALLSYWENEQLGQQVRRYEAIVLEELGRLVARYASWNFVCRGRGLIQGLDLHCGELATKVIREAFARGLILEACGAFDEVLKIMPALTTPETTLREGLEIVADCLAIAIERTNAAGSPSPVPGMPNAPPIASTISFTPL